MKTAAALKRLTIFIVLGSMLILTAYADSHQLPYKSNAQKLGWVSTPQEPCDGYYIETPIDYPFTVTKDPNKSPIDIQSTKTRYAQKGTSLLQGNVIVTQVNKQLVTDKAYLIRDPKTGKINVIHALGGVDLRQPGGLLYGSEATVTLDNKTWHITNPVYRFVMDKQYKPHIITTDQPYEVKALSGWGSAQQAYKDEQGIVNIHNGTFSTCSPERTFWQLKANTMKLNRQSGRGTAYNSILYIKGLPVFYTPYANFPIDKRRQTGFLYPSFNFSSVDGLDVALPFYWNIAPNYDATLTTHFVERRGARFDGQFRYLLGLPNSTGTISGILLPYDREFAQFKRDASNEFDQSVPANRDNLNTLENASNTRGYIHWDNTTRWDTHWRSQFNYNYASDDYFPQDFAINTSGITNQQLQQQINTTYSSLHWHLLANIENYQTLHPINQAPVANAYTRLPQLNAVATYPAVLPHVDFDVKSDFTNFLIDPNPGMTQQPVNGLRYNIDPKLSFPWHWGQAAYIKPTAQFDVTTYALNDSGSLSPNPTVALPLLDVDAGLFFDRNTTLPILNKSYTQTLEPRLFYLYVPYKNQDNIPIFDTSVRTFDASQLYATNRFTGLDRIGDANQVSFSLTSRLLDQQTGREKAALIVGQILYFRDRQVQLCSNGSDSCDTLEPDARRSDGTSSTDTFSPLIGQLDYHLTDDLTTNIATAWSPENGRVTSGTLDLQYKPDMQHIINLGYTFLRDGDVYPVPAGQPSLPTGDSRNNLSQADISLTWPIWGGWSALGRFNYNISHDYAQDYFYGVQYDSHCWAIRAIGSRYFYNFNNFATPQFRQEYYLQFLFKGIGAVGSADPNSLLRQGIYGYQDPFRQNR